jgi:hypothetical protein
MTTLFFFVIIQSKAKSLFFVIQSAAIPKAFGTHSLYNRLAMSSITTLRFVLDDNSSSFCHSERSDESPPLYHRLGRSPDIYLGHSASLHSG